METLGAVSQFDLSPVSYGVGYLVPVTQMLTSTEGETEISLVLLKTLKYIASGKHCSTSVFCFKQIKAQRQ